MSKALLALSLLFAISAEAYDPCETRGTVHALAESKCYRIKVNAPDLDEQFQIAAVRLTEKNEFADQRDSIILIPGGPGADSQSLAMSLNSKDIMNAFWKHLKLNVILYDPRGTGASQLSQEIQNYPVAAISTQKQVSDLKALIDEVSPHKSVILFAHSAGGNTAAKFAAEYPERVKALILYSASIDNREIGETNLRLFAKDFEFWNNYQASCSQHPSLKDRFQWIESFLRNALKLKRILGHRSSALASLYLKDFRAELIRAIENDPGCNSRVPQTIRNWERKISALPIGIKERVSELDTLKFHPDDQKLPVLKRSLWYKTALICSEGITKTEIQSPLWLEGLRFSDDTCKGIDALYDTPPSREWLEKIQAPSLLIGGREDERQIPSAVTRNAKDIKGSKLLLIEDAGHEAHKSHPWLVYSTILEFLAGI